MRWKEIIWDWNGTLINDVELCIEIINDLLIKYEKPTLTLEKYHQVFDFPVKEYYRRIGFNFDETPFEVVGSEFMESYWQRWNECELHDGAVEFIRALDERSVKQTIISAAETKLVKAGLEYFNLDSIFNDFHGLDHHYATSKESLVVNYVNSTTSSFEEILFIGDTLHDYHVAQNADLACILFAGGHHSFEKLAGSMRPVFKNFAGMHRFISDMDE